MDKRKRKSGGLSLDIYEPEVYGDQSHFARQGDVYMKKTSKISKERMIELSEIAILYTDKTTSAKYAKTQEEQTSFMQERYDLIVDLDIEERKAVRIMSKSMLNSYSPWGFNYNMSDYSDKFKNSDDSAAV